MKRFLPALLLLFSAALLPHTLGAQQTATITSDRVNVRASAAIDASIVGTLARGTTVTVLETGETWVKVSSGNLTGWVRISTLSMGGSVKASGPAPAASRPTAPTRQAPAEQEQEPVARPVAPHAGFGVQGSWGDDSDLGVGARVELNLLGKVASKGVLQNAFAIGEFNYYFTDCRGVSCNVWEINPGLAVPIVTPSADFYAGAGLNIAHWSANYYGYSDSESDIGLNLFGGIRFPLAGRAGFAEAKLSSGGTEQLSISVGVLLGSK